MRPLLVALITTCFSVGAIAQTGAPGKPPSQAKPKAPLGCKSVGTVKGTKLWAGDCVASGLRGAEPAETERRLLVQSSKFDDHYPPAENHLRRRARPEASAAC